MYSCKFALKEVSRINILAILYQTLIVNRLLSSIFATYVNKSNRCISACCVKHNVCWKQYDCVIDFDLPEAMKFGKTRVKMCKIKCNSVLISNSKFYSSELYSSRQNLLNKPSCNSNTNQDLDDLKVLISLLLQTFFKH